MSNETAKRRIPDGAYATAQELLENGESPEAVEEKLVGLGVSLADAKRIVADHSRATVQSTQSSARTDLMFSALVVALAVVIQIVSWARGEGISFVAALCFVIGAFRLIRAWRQKG